MRMQSLFYFSFSLPRDLRARLRANARIGSALCGIIAPPPAGYPILTRRSYCARSIAHIIRARRAPLLHSIAATVSTVTRYRAVATIYQFITLSIITALYLLHLPELLCIFRYAVYRHLSAQHRHLRQRQQHTVAPSAPAAPARAAATRRRRSAAATGVGGGGLTFADGRRPAARAARARPARRPWHRALAPARP